LKNETLRRFRVKLEVEGLCLALFLSRAAFDVLGPAALLLGEVKVLALSTNTGPRALGGAADVSVAS